MKRKLLKAKNGQAVLALILLMFVAGGCSNIFSGGDESANANANTNTEKKVERKEYTLKNASNSSELVNALKTFNAADNYVQSELINPEKVAKEKKMYDSSIAEAKLKFTGVKNPIYLRIAKFSSNAEGLKKLDGREAALKSKGEKPVKGEKDGVTTLIWFDKDFSNVIQCKADYCFEAFGIPDGKKLEESLAPLTIISTFKDKV